MNKQCLIKSGGILSALVLSACTAAPNQDLQKKYFEMVRELNMTPVYPPREEFNVGDVFFVSYDRDDPNNLNKSVRFYVATIDDLKRQGNRYLSSRTTYKDTNDKDNAFVTSGKQEDFDGSVVSTNAASRKSLPLVTFPTISGAASTAGALGSFGFTRSIGLNFGSAETVSIDFTDTRAFGTPDGFISATPKFMAEYRSEVCRFKADFVRQAESRGREKNIPAENLCAGSRMCQFSIITRTITTRKIDYRYTGAQIARLAASVRRGELPTNPTTLPVTTNIDLNLSVGDKTSADDLAKLAAALQPSVSNPDTSSEFNGLSFTGFQGNALTFDRQLQKPVAIAYESRDDFLGDSPFCQPPQ